MIYEIKRGSTIIWSGKAKGTQHKKIMQEDRVEIEIKSPAAISFRKGDTIEIYGQTYKLNRPENISKVNTQIGYTYNIEFEALYYDLGKWILYTLDKNNQLKEPDVYIMGEASVILGLLVQNANRASSGWSLGSIETTEVIQWTYSSAKLLTVLQDVADQTNLEFWVHGKEINLTRRQPVTGITLEYGMGKGLYELQRSRRTKPVVTHLTVLGGSKNIPNGYGFRNIQPKGGNPMVNPNHQIGDDIVEDTIVFENVYPRLIAAVTSVQANNIIRSSDIDFNLNNYLLDDGTSAQIAFTSGLLNGFKFTIRDNGYDHATKQVTFNIIQDDNAYPGGVPDNILKPAVGDKFVFLNISMPETYVSNAEDRTKDLGDQYFDEEGIEQYDWSGNITPKFVIENQIEFTLGGLIRLKATDIDFDDNIRIASYTRDLQEEYRYTFTLSNVVSINSLVRQRNMSDRLANTVSKGISSDGLSTKATYAEKAGYAGTAGHALTATNAAIANYANEALHSANSDNSLQANYALDSDKWDGRQFSDYLNQGVRTIDSPLFQGVNAVQKLLIPQISSIEVNAIWKSGEYLMAGSAKIKAGNSDRWNSLLQPDYLDIDNPLRKADSPKFTGISSPVFASGMTGSGYRMAKDANGDYILETDRLLVRKDFSVYELVVNKIRASNGSIWVTDAIKITGATVSGSNYICTIDTANNTVSVPFVANDLLRCQIFNGQNVKYYTARVVSVSAGSFTITRIDGTGVPANGDELVRVGNTTNTARQGSLYLTASDSGAPYLDVMDGVTAASFSGKTKVRLGNLSGIVDADFGALSGYGIYAERGYFKGTVQVTGGNAETISGAQSKATAAQTAAINAAATDATNKVSAIKLFNPNLFPLNRVSNRDNYIKGAYSTLKPEKRLQLEPNTEYIFSFSSRKSVPGGYWGVLNITIDGGTGQNVFNQNNTSSTTPNDTIFPGLSRIFTTGPSGIVNFSYYDDRYGNSPIGVNWFTDLCRELKIEKGNKVTGYVISDEDLLDMAFVAAKTETTTQFNVLATEINSKVSQATFNALDQRVGTAESTIVQQAGLISQRVTSSEFSNFQLSNNNAIATAQSNAISTAATDATNKATAAQTAAINAAATDATNKVAVVATRVTTAETNISQLSNSITLKADQTTVNSLTTTVNGKANQSTVTALETRVSAAEVKITPDAINLTVSSQVDTKVNAVQVGGRNLLRGSGVGIETGAYLMKSYTLSEAPVVGENYTITLWGNLASTKTRFTIYNSGGSVHLANLIKVSEGIYRATFLWINTNGTTTVSPTYINVYHFASNETGVSRIDRIKLEKGNKGSDWTPANEDVQSDIEARPTNAQIQAGITITSGAINIFGQSLSLAGKVTFSSLDAGAQGQIDTIAQTKANTAQSNAATDATTKANNAQSNAISTAATDATNKATAAQTAAINAAATDATNKVAVETNARIALANSLKAMAFQDVVEISKLGNTVIQGGYLATNLIDVNYIRSNIVLTTDLIADKITSGILQSVGGGSYFNLNENKFKIGAGDNSLDWNVTTANQLTVKGRIETTEGKIGGLNIDLAGLTIGSSNSWTINTNYVRMSKEYFVYRKNGGTQGKVREVAFDLYSNILGAPYTYAIDIKNNIDNVDSFDPGVNTALRLEARNANKTVALEIVAGGIRIKGSDGYSGSFNYRDGNNHYNLTFQDGILVNRYPV